MFSRLLEKTSKFSRYLHVMISKMLTHTENVFKVTREDVIMTF